MSRGWPSSPDTLPRANGRSYTAPPFIAPLAIVPLPDDHEYLRSVAKPHLYDERDVEHLREMFLVRHNLTDWDCRCGARNTTPDAEFFANGVSTPCATCGEA